MKFIFTQLLVFLLITTGQAQKFELGDVTKEQLQEQYHPLDSTSSAAYLFKNAKTKFKYSYKDGFTLFTEFSIKIKIYKKEGLKYANFEIPYYVGYENLDDELVTISKAFTYNLENGKITKEKVSGDGKFKEKVNELWETKIITFPNVKVGSIIELKYELQSQNLSELPVFQYQYKIPVNHAQYITEIPVFYIYKGIKIGYVDLKMDEVLENKSINYENEHRGTETLSYNQIKTNYEINNVQALFEESYVNNINDYYGKIEHELQIIQFPNEKPKKIATTWEDVALSIFQNKSFGNEILKTNYYLTDLKQITDKVDDKQERLKAIFQFVKNKMNWNGKYGYYTSKNLEIAYKENSGNIADINLILVSMLKMGGLEASPVLLSTRENGVALFPNRSKFNYVIAAVLLDGKYILLDATSKFSDVNMLPLRDLNDKGRLINNDGISQEIDLMPKNNSLDNTNLLVTIGTDGIVTGNVREQYSDYEGLRFREKYSGLAQESYLEKIESKYKGTEIIKYELRNEKSFQEPIIESYSITNNNVVEIINNKMYFTPLLYMSTPQNPFKQENRKYPIDFVFPFIQKISLSITIPDGYTVESIPKPLNISFGDSKEINYLFNANFKGNQIIVSSILNTSTSTVLSDEYANLKEFYKIMIEKQNEKIVLKKI